MSTRLKLDHHNSRCMGESRALLESASCSSARLPDCMGRQPIDDALDKDQCGRFWETGVVSCLDDWNPSSPQGNPEITEQVSKRSG